jgi:trehalose synthase
MAKLHEYIPIVGQFIIDDLKMLGTKLKGKVIQNINSTAYGGGVAEILRYMIPLLNELGVDARWDVIKGSNEFFGVTKKFHNALHGRTEVIESRDFDIFNQVSQQNIEGTDTYGDIVFVHDPQPIALIKKKADNKWLWRCHIDISAPDMRVWRFLKRFVVNYDSVVCSAPAFAQRLNIRQFLIPPSIDPLNDKNRELSQEEIDTVLYRYGINKDKPIIAQISRFDYLKDPVGVIEAYRLVKKYNDCQLVLAGNRAADDPESDKVLAEVRERAAGDPDIHLLLIPKETNDIDINALQRAAAVVVQKSVREGFGLVVSEALWKAKPMVASAVGGIPLQIKHKYSGLLCHSVEGAAFGIKQLLNSPSFAKRLGDNARENVRTNFLLTRHLRDYMLTFLSLYHPEGVVYFKD